ncbi:MAG: hypothetical protein WCH85_09285 [Methanomicrobiales archaeon]
MTGEESSRQEPENLYIPPKEATVTQDPKPADKRPGKEWLGFVYMIVGLFILIAAFQLYFTIQELIRIWISDQFVPVVSAIYYIVVIVVGIWLLRDYIRNQ